MKNTLFYAEREFQTRARLAARAAKQERILQSLPGSPVDGSVAGLVNRMAAGIRSLWQAVPEAGRLSIESNTPQEQSC